MNGERDRDREREREIEADEGRANDSVETEEMLTGGPYHQPTIQTLQENWIGSVFTPSISTP